MIHCDKDEEDFGMKSFILTVWFAKWKWKSCEVGKMSFPFSLTFFFGPLQIGHSHFILELIQTSIH